MEKEVQIVSLDRDTVLMALPLIRETAPEMTIENLRAYVENLRRNGDDSESTARSIARFSSGPVFYISTAANISELRRPH